MGFDCPARHAIIPRSFEGSWDGADTFHYIFDHPIGLVFPNTSIYEPCTYTSCHGAEIVFVFGTFEDIGIPARPAELSLSLRLKKYWTQFGWTGNPNIRGVHQEEVPTQELPCWHRYANIDTATCDDSVALPPYESMHLHSGEFEDLTDPDMVNYHCDFWD